MNESARLAVSGLGEAMSPRPELFEPKSRAAVRYADPAAWITASAVALALSESRAPLASSLHDVGIVVVSDQGASATMLEMDKALASGFSSPLRYAAANPSSLAGVACIMSGLRGPTICFTMAAGRGVPAALQLCACWLARRAARLMLLATFQATGLSKGCSRAVLLRYAGTDEVLSDPLTPSIFEWLIQTATEPSHS